LPTASLCGLLQGLATKVVDRYSCAESFSFGLIRIHYFLIKSKLLFKLRYLFLLCYWLCLILLNICGIYITQNVAA
jgi:hypothetical protein